LFYVEEEEAIFTNLMKPLIVLVKQNLLISSMASSKWNAGFLSRCQFTDSNLPSKMRSRKVKAVPLIKRACRCSFIPMNVETVFCKLKRKLGSSPPMWLN